MIMLFLQTLIFIAVAFVLGCLAGCWLRTRTKASGQARSGAAAAITPEGAARTVTASELAAPQPHYEPVTTPQPVPLASGSPASGKTPPAGDTASGEAAEVSTGRAAKPAPKKAAAKRAAGKSASGSKRTDKKAAATASGAGAKTPSAKAPAAKSGSGVTSSAKPAAKASAASKPAAKTAAKAKPGPAAVADDLKRIKGVGPQLEAKLNAIGINSFAQIASWTKKDQAAFGEQLFFQGRVERDEWVAQAKVLAKGGATAFSKRVAKGEVPSSAGAKRKRGTPKGD
ncbi:hypothetical protein [uncultured Hoeflea sp.]|uniref:hypothetical protein n=1 Tax=uncultured Hoeflea sp. TaxID=538666 RepID=UPI00260212E0|nr:hypothetical protein [uncultured Hoeflea sp.]